MQNDRSVKICECLPLASRPQPRYPCNRTPITGIFIMASFFKSLFGGGKAAPAEAPQAEGHEHKGFVIRATPYKDGGQYQTCGTVEKEIDGELKIHKFIRADRFGSLDDAIQFSLTKGRQLVDEQGERLFG